MTEKELLYLEDAVMHEKSIVGICQDLVIELEDDSLKDFINEEITKHENIQTNLMNLLKEIANE